MELFDLSKDHSSYNCLSFLQLFHGNTDSRSSMANAFSPPIEAEYVRIYPQLCWGHCTLRMELLGCDLTGQ